MSIPLFLPVDAERSELVSRVVRIKRDGGSAQLWMLNKDGALDPHPQNRDAPLVCFVHHPHAEAWLRLAGLVKDAPMPEPDDVPPRYR